MDVASAAARQLRTGRRVRTRAAKAAHPRRARHRPARRRAPRRAAVQRRRATPAATAPQQPARRMAYSQRPPQRQAPPAAQHGESARVGALCALRSRTIVIAGASGQWRRYPPSRRRRHRPRSPVERSRCARAAAATRACTREYSRSGARGFGGRGRADDARSASLASCSCALFARVLLRFTTAAHAAVAGYAAQCVTANLLVLLFSTRTACACTAAMPDTWRTHTPTRQQRKSRHAAREADAASRCQKCKLVSPTMQRSERTPLLSRQ
jgi:hypothetical protein